ncbi:MAG: sulfotransferase [Cyanobacteria bacterium J06639_14]
MRQKLEVTILELIEAMTEEWELELDEDISLGNKLIDDLGFSSVDFVQFFVAIEDEVQQKLGFHDLIMVDGKYIDDLSITEIVTFVEGKLNSSQIEPPVAALVQPAKLDEQAKINSAKVALFQKAIPIPSAPLPVTDKNPPAIFILCPSRSGSTLLRVVLAGNPQLFAPPELHLLSFETLTQRKVALNNEVNAHLLNGTIRALMQAKGCGLEEAQAIMADCEQKGFSSKDFYYLLQQSLGDRTLVDKTPSYAYHINFLKRSEANFTNALYIHLLRHPYGAIRSFEDAKLDRLLPFMQSDTFSRREYAELAWLVCQQNILDFLKAVPAHRQFQVKFEDLVCQPTITVKQICEFLGVNFYPTMLDPYQEKSQRMTDGVEAVSKMSGDLKFYLHREIESNMAYRWQQFHTTDFLGDDTWQVAELMGYQRV